MRSVSSPDIEKAVTLFRAGDMVAAAQACKAVLHRNSRDVLALHLLALTVMQQRDFARAERIFAKLIQVEPNSAEIWTNRGSNLIAMNMFEPAREAFDRAVAIKPAFPKVLYNRAKLLSDMGRFEEEIGR